MKTNINTVETVLSSLDVRLPVELPSRPDIEEYLDQLGHVVALPAGERQRFGGLLHAAEHITFKQLDEVLSEPQQNKRKPDEILSDKSVLKRRGKDAVLQFQRRQAGVSLASGEFTLGNILVTNGQITRPQLDEALRRQVESGRRLGEELIKSGHVNKGQVEGGLLLQRKLIAYALAVTVGFGSHAPLAEAAQKSAAMPVSVTVVSNAKMQTNYQAKQLKITEADVARGYVDIADAFSFSISTNSRSGYLMEFHPVTNLFEAVQVSGLGNPVQLGADGGAIVQRGSRPPNQSHELSFRFTLHQDAKPGSYPWPLLLSVRAL
jgi:hypothetical protein